MKYINRIIRGKTELLHQGFPVIVVTGPRQSGKTTFLRHFKPNYEYFNLELPSTLEEIKIDPLKFFADHSKNIIIDEVQRYPELLSYVQVHVDEKQEMGAIYLSGSQNLLVSEKISQSLAGRAAYINLLPMTYAELQADDNEPKNYDNYIFKGGYPSLYVKDIDSDLYFEQYIATYLERDVREIKSVNDLSLFRKFMKLIAGRVGQLLSESSLAKDVGVSPNTISSWISILEASYIIFRLPPYFTNQSKRLIKSAKIYFNDTGLLCNLLEIDSINELVNHNAYGSIFENSIINELNKKILSERGLGKLYFYRDSHHNEIDIVVDQGNRKLLVEIKSSKIFSNTFQNGINYWRKHYNQDQTGFIIYGGMKSTNVGKDKLLSYKDALSIFNY